MMREIINNGFKGPEIQKKNITFLSSDAIYQLIVSSLVSSLRRYEQLEHENFRLESIRFSLSNVISILTKLFDFSYLYIYGSIYTILSYGMGSFSNNRYILSFINYHYIFALAFTGVLFYIGLIQFHKKEIVTGSLGVDENQRAVSFTNVKYYTTFLLFLMGSSLSNLFIMTSLNAYMCDETTFTLWNFPDNECYSTLHVLEMFGSLLMLLSYYPLASLIFPFSSAIDRTL